MHFAAVSALSHDGLIREHNEDSLVAGPWTLCSATTATPQTIYFPLGDPLIVAVADGLGGHPAGEEASSIAVQWLSRHGLTLADEDALRSAIDECNAQIRADSERNPEHMAMGTTIAGVLITETSVITFNVGDSRVYGVDDSGVTLLSTDDNEPPLPGQQRSSVVTQVLGGGIERAALDPHISSRPLPATARYLICSDGLTDAIDDDDIAAILRRSDGGKATFELWKATIEAGAPDNITVALVEIDST